MYGTIFRMKVKQGQEQRVVDIFKEWEMDRKPHVKGVVAGLLMKPDKASGEFVGVAVFEDKTAFMANADDPEQDKWFRKLREILTEDPAWEDGEYVAGGIG